MPAALSLGDADAERLRGLRRMQGVALGLLVVAAVVYALTTGEDGALGYVNAAAEASMVGAVADWFAVTALFRRPLGLPIPHTALIPERKDQLGRSLEAFVTENFLTAEIVRGRVEAAELSRRAGAWLAAPENAARVVRHAAPALANGLRALDRDEVRAIVEQALLPRLGTEQLSPAAGLVLARVLDDGAHEPLVDLGLAEALRWLRANEETVVAIVNERAPGWTPHWLEGRVSRRVHRELVRWVIDIRDDPRHRARGALEDLLRRLAEDLQHDPATQARADALKHRILASPAAGDAATAITLSVRSAVVDALRHEGGPVHERATAVLVDAGRRLVEDPALRERLDARAADAVVALVETYGGEIAATISYTIDQWDGEEAARRLELMVGRDLQFIRINGTVIGAVAGLTIHALSAAL